MVEERRIWFDAPHPISVLEFSSFDFLLLFLFHSSYNLAFNILKHVSLFLCWDLSFWHWTTIFVGMWVILTALSVVFTCWPPAPLDLNVLFASLFHQYLHQYHLQLQDKPKHLQNLKRSCATIKRRYSD